MNSSSSLPRNTPENLGISPAAIENFALEASQTIRYIHSFMLLRHGQVAAESWWHPYRPAAPHTMFSVSKSFTSTAIGLAVAEGLFSVEDRVMDFFDKPRKTSPRLASMQIRHLLTMTSGHHADTIPAMMQSPETPEQTFLNLHLRHQPGTRFIYNSGATYMLSSILQKTSGQTLLDYLTPRVLEPLGILNAFWESHSNGVNFGGWGLHIKTEDIARLGQLYLQKGSWHGQQLLPASWVEAATSKQVENGPSSDADWNQGYGYQFWRCQKPGIYRADGAFGQFCIVMPEQDAVLAMTGGSPVMQPMLDLVWKHLLPGLQDASAGTSTLHQTLSTRSITPPEGATSSPLAQTLAQKTYQFGENPVQLSSLHLDFASKTLDYVSQGQPHQLKFGVRAWGPDELLYFSPATPDKVTASGVWEDDTTFCLTVSQYETPTLLTIKLKFESNQLQLTHQANLNLFGPPPLDTLTGQLTL